MVRINKVKLIKPRPFAIVGLKFDIVGEIPKSWSIFGEHEYAPSINWLNENGNYLPMSGPSAETIPSIFSKLKNRVKFCSHIDLYSKDPEHPHGIIIEISGRNDDQLELFPFIIGGTNQSYDKECAQLRKKLAVAVERVYKLKNDWNIYWSEIGKISRETVWDKKITEDITHILDNSEETFKPFVESDEEQYERELREKYKDAIEWQGPILGGRTGGINGFDFRVYSGDHSLYTDRQVLPHFHIVHKGRGISARFSFPGIELIDYLGHSNTLGAKDINKIKEYFMVPNNLIKLKTEFQKQILV
jgi:hypothetical protein